MDAAYGRLRDFLGQGTGFDLLQLPAECSKADAIWVIRSAAGESRVVVESKSTIWPRDVESVAARLRVCEVEDQAERRLLVAPSLTKRTRELLQRSDVDYIDAQGEMRIAIPGRLLILASGKKDASAYRRLYSRDRIANPFRGKASRVVRALLAESGRWWQVTELAECVDVSAALVVKTLNTLEDDRYVRRSADRQVGLSDGEALLKRWSDVTKSAFRDAATFTSSVSDPDSLTTQLSKALGGLGVPYAITRLAAARFIEPYAPASAVDIYIEGDASEVASVLGLLPVERGESVRLVVARDVGVFQFNLQRSGVTIVNPVQLFVDLSQGGGREPDVAERLFERQLRQALSRSIEP